MFTCAEQEDFMRKVWWELSRCMTRAGLQSKGGSAELLSRSWRYSWGSFEGYQACKRPSLGEGVGQGSAKAPPPKTKASTSPPPSPPQSHPADEQLHHHMEILHLCSRSWEFRSRTQQCNAFLQGEEKPKKQVWFEVDAELGDEPTDLACFLAEGTAPKQSSVPS